PDLAQRLPGGPGGMRTGPVRHHPTGRRRRHLARRRVRTGPDPAHTAGDRRVVPDADAATAGRRRRAHRPARPRRAAPRRRASRPGGGNTMTDHNTVTTVAGGDDEVSLLSWLRTVADQNVPDTLGGALVPVA